MVDKRANAPPFDDGRSSVTAECAVCARAPTETAARVRRGESLERPRVFAGLSAARTSYTRVHSIFFLHLTPNGGSLGSWIDEDRSYLRVVV